ncbi:hypothetical protein CEK00_09505 [Stenotrophomonas maltophilia]|uniref:Uncharacterized protein n=1 Tax=Stenotrophomonas maltophilia TaxID=40324 RepID=A0A270MXW3_STEMA|nr:hypothetical protein CEK00_21825 [Stenotrophomonas maltophilia]PAM71818.1 hypothetical protein CEK00_09505 [Stenotrophomonas maltophilia]
MLCPAAQLRAQPLADHRHAFSRATVPLTLRRRFQGLGRMAHGLAVGGGSAHAQVEQAGAGDAQKA